MPGPTLTPIPGGRAQPAARAKRATAAGPPLTAHDGDNMNADDAAYLAVADAAESAVGLPGVSDECVATLMRIASAGDRAAGLPPRRARTAALRCARLPRRDEF